MRKRIGLLTMMMILGTGCLCLEAQDELPFRGTWKIDIEAFSKTATGTGITDAQLQMKLGRMKDMRYILNEDAFTVVTDDFPRTMKWEKVREEGRLLEFQVKPRGELIRIEVLQDNLIEFTTVVGDQQNTARLVRESDVDKWVSPGEFEIGMLAPQIVADRWLTDLNRPLPIENGKVYVLDFWATWCGPCFLQMPKLVEIQKEHGSASLCVIAISNESWETVEAFLSREPAPGDEPSAGDRLVDMSKTICIGVDHESETFRSYMVAAGLRAIPTAFVIGRTGHVEWVGPSEELEDILPSILDGTWDRESFAKRFSDVRKAYVEFPKVQQFISEGEWDAANKLVDDLIPLADTRLRLNLEALKSRLQGQQPRK